MTTQANHVKTMRQQVRAELRRRGWTPYKLAQVMGCQRKSCYRALANDSNSSEMLGRMGAALGMQWQLK